MVKITEAQSDDLIEIAAFARVTYAAAFGAELGMGALQKHLETQLSDDHFVQMLAVDQFYLARSATELVGFGQIGLVDPAYADYLDEFDVTGVELRRLYVHPDVQSKGIGSELIQQVLRDPMVLISKVIYLTTWESNLGARKLYAMHNFTKLGEIAEYDEDGELNGYEHILARFKKVGDGY